MAGWFMSGGPDQCAGCHEDPEFACSRFGGPGTCPQDSNRFISHEGAAIWATFTTILRQARVGFSGFIGLDIPACMEMLDVMGVDRAASAVLLPYVETAVLTHIRSKER